MKQSRSLKIYLLAMLAWALALAADLYLGAFHQATLQWIYQLRLPRALLASGVGAGLAVSGTLLQALFANPLCEPYTLGISSGATLGAVIATTLGISGVLAGVAWPAFLGSLIFAGILYQISRKGQRSQSTLLLAGVMLGFLGSSLVALWMALSDPNGISGMLYWMMGDLSRARMIGALITLVGVLLLTSLSWSSAIQLDALIMGEEDARSLGIPLDRVRVKLILYSSFMVALCVSSAGMIGFVGLVIPHLARKCVGSLHFKLLPLTFILGAATLTAADCIARVIASPYELPVGVVTAILGAPVFLWLLLKKNNG